MWSGLFKSSSEAVFLIVDVERSCK